MELFDKKAKGNVTRYVLQCSLATVTILIILLFLNLFTQASIIASLGATTFIVFAMPNSTTAQRRNLVGGYLVGIVIGILSNIVATLLISNFLTSTQNFIFILFGSISVGITILTMVITDTEHPPAVGMSLALVLNSWNYKTILFVFCSVILMSLVKRLLRSVLIDLT
ncbi:MAG: HPP family protein [Firmicutes bacterium]|nr:HPP family protein [Bacillota bacterium]